MPVEYLNPDLALPTPAVSGPMVSTVNSLSTMSSVLSTVNLLPSLTDITATTTTTTTAVTNSVAGSVRGVVPSGLATGLEFLALAPRPFGVETQPAGQALPGPAAATFAVQPFTATTSAAVQLPGSLTTGTIAVPASTAATVVVPAVPPKSTTTSSAVPTTSATTTAASAALSAPTAVSSVMTVPEIITSTVESSSSITGVAVTVSSSSNSPGSMYVASTQPVVSPVIVVYSQDVLKRYDGSSSPKEYMNHFDCIADVNGWKTDLDKLKHLKATPDGHAALQIHDLDESDPAKPFAALRGRLLGHSGSPNEAESARPGRGRGRGRRCYVRGTFGCHSRNHVEEQAAEFRRY